MIYKHAIYRFRSHSIDDFIWSMIWSNSMLSRHAIYCFHPINFIQSISSDWWFHPTMIRTDNDSIWLMIPFESRALPIFSLLKIFYKDALTRSYRWRFWTRWSDQSVRSYAILSVMVSNALLWPIYPISVNQSISSGRHFQPIDDPIDFIRSMRLMMISFYRFHPAMILINWWKLFLMGTVAPHFDWPQSIYLIDSNPIDWFQLIGIILPMIPFSP